MECGLATRDGKTEDDDFGEFGGGCPTSDEEADMWREGWGLWALDDGLSEIQKFDEDPKQRFISDEDAIKFVRAKALTGSKMHLEAVALHHRATSHPHAKRPIRIR